MCDASKGVFWLVVALLQTLMGALFLIEGIRVEKSAPSTILTLSGALTLVAGVFIAYTSWRKNSPPETRNIRLWLVASGIFNVMNVVWIIIAAVNADWYNNEVVTVFAFNVIFVLVNGAFWILVLRMYKTNSSRT